MELSLVEIFIYRWVQTNNSPRFHCLTWLTVFICIILYRRVRLSKSSLRGKNICVNEEPHVIQSSQITVWSLLAPWWRNNPLKRLKQHVPSILLAILQSMVFPWDFPTGNRSLGNCKMSPGDVILKRKSRSEWTDGRLDRQIGAWLSSRSFLSRSLNIREATKDNTGKQSDPQVCLNKSCCQELSCKKNDGSRQE